MRGALVGAILVGLTACSGGTSTAPSPTSAPTTTVPAAPTAPSTTPSPSATPSTSAITSTTAPTTAPPTTPTTTTAAAPRAVSELEARAGGGSGEIVVSWRGVGPEVGYVVQWAPAPVGPFAFAATYGPDGRVTRGDGVTNVFVAGDGTFTYVEVSTAVSNSGVQRWFRVVAFNDGGSAAPSRVVCGSPPGAPGC